MRVRIASWTTVWALLLTLAATALVTLPAVAAAGHRAAPVGNPIVQTLGGPLETARGEDTTTLTGVSCVSPAIAYVSGLHDTIYRTTDGGATWTRLSSPLPQDEEVSDIEFVSATTGWATGVNNAILRTTDGGGRWTSQVFSGSLYPPYLLALSAVDATHAWIGGYYTADYHLYTNVVLRTTNGTDWQMSPNLIVDQSTGYGVTAVDFPDRLHGWGTVMGGAIIFSNDGGSVWSPPIDIAQASSLVDVSFADATHGWAVGEDSSYNGFIMHTADGTNWYRQADSVTLPDVRAVCAVDQNVAWAACAGGTVMKTEDAGQTWTLFQDTPVDLNAVDATAAVAWVVGDGGTYLRYGDRYTPPKPALDKLKPAGGSVRSLVTLYGRGFGALRDRSFVTFGGKKATVKSWTDTRIKVTVPAGIARGYVKVKVTTAGGASAARKFLRS